MEMLPEEIHTEIFSYLDHSSLQTAASVSKKWRSNVLGSSRLLRKSKLRVHDYKQQKGFIKSTGKRFRAVCIKNKENGQNKCSRPELLTILRGIANVRNLELSGDFLGFPERKVSSLQLKNLEELTLNGSANSSRVSKILNHVKPQKLTLDVSENWRKMDKHFESWLLKQDRLKDLHVKDRAMMIFSKEFPVDKLKIQLRKLTLEVTSFHELWLLNSSMILQRNMINFCRSQRSLEDVRLSALFITDPIIAHLLDSRSLKKLTYLSYKGVPAIESRSNESLEDLCISYGRPGSASTITPTWQTLAKLKKLKNLEINFQGHQVQEIITNCSRLTQLMTMKLTKINFNGHELAAFNDINLPNLRTIDLGNIYVTKLGWTSITKKCPLVESLTLEGFVLNHGSASVICEQWKYLKFIELGYGFYLEEIFSALLKCKTLKQVKINDKMKQQLEVRLGEAKAPFEITVKHDVPVGLRVDLLAERFGLLVDRSLYLDNFPDID
jgi:hypothetical protein